jgi:hypothetical protein
MRTITTKNYRAIHKQAGVENNPRFKGPYNPNRDNPMWPMNDLPRMRMRSAVSKELQYSLDRESMREASNNIDNCIEQLENALRVAGETIVAVRDCAKKFDIEEQDVWGVIGDSRSVSGFGESINNLQAFLSKHCNEQSVGGLVKKV